MEHISHHSPDNEKSSELASGIARVVTIDQENLGSVQENTILAVRRPLFSSRYAIEARTRNVIKVEPDLIRKLPKLESQVQDFWIEIINDYADPLRRYISRLLYKSNPDAIDDVLQTVWVKALNGISRIKEWDSGEVQDVRLKGWFYMIAHNHIISMVRAHNRRKEDSLDYNLEQHGYDLGNVDPNIQSIGERVGLGDAFLKLTPLQQRVIRLRIVEDLSIAETARLIGRGEDAVKKLQSRALNSMKRSLEGKESGY